MPKEVEEKSNYSDLVRSVVDNKKYFEDAMDWYCLKYLSVISERTFFIVLSLMSFIIVAIIVLTIKNILPLSEVFPVLVNQKDSVNYYSTIKSIKPANMDYDSNEAILRFMLIRYVREMFNHNYKTGKIEDLNYKLNRIKIYSTDEVMQKFRADFNEISAAMFNKNIEQRTYIRTFKFGKKQRGGKSEKKNILTSIGNSLFSKKIPTEAELDYEVHTITSDSRTVENYKITLSFKYEPIKFNNFRNSFTKPVLVITSYNVVNRQNNVNTSKNKINMKERERDETSAIENKNQSGGSQDTKNLDGEDSINNTSVQNNGMENSGNGGVIEEAGNSSNANQLVNEKESSNIPSGNVDGEVDVSATGSSMDGTEMEGE